MSNLYTQQSSNITKTWLFLAFFLVLVIAIGFVFAQALGNPTILYAAVGLALILNVGSYWYSDKLVLGISKAKPADEQVYIELHRIVENLAITAGLPKPRVYVMQEPQPNAFATGRDPKHAVIAVTTGLIDVLDRKELEGVIAHELAHIGNRDMLLTTVVVVLAGFISILSDMFLRWQFYGGHHRSSSKGGNQAAGIFMIIALVLAIIGPLLALLIRLAISRKREFLADASGAMLTRYPEGLASALQKISAYPQTARVATKPTASLFIANPFRGKRLSALFMTHPPIEERVKALLDNVKE
ncbi:MAG: Protease HtpX-like protein [Parcubacteria group bacterium GW2011_GWA2_47_8]|nr:MAG: Protease HtpX-like protein [Parcubacteria group bacterium GW2011_GWA2_47_8]